MNGHIKGLDALRAIAVLMVMISHFLEGSSFIYSLNLGHFGVMLFFMLSGFLISRIILNEKRKNTPLKTFLKAFYARRALRIFPLFYLAIGVFSILGIGFGDFIWWHITYTTNFLLAKIGSGFMGTHFWSLAVEEQFYLLYPAVLFAIPRKSERKLLVSLCLMYFKPILLLEHPARTSKLRSTVAYQLGLSLPWRNTSPRGLSKTFPKKHSNNLTTRFTCLLSSHLR